MKPKVLVKSSFLVTLFAIATFLNKKVIEITFSCFSLSLECHGQTGNFESLT